MKKALALLLALTLCLSVMAVSAFAAGDTWRISGTMNSWNQNSSDRMTDNGDGTYSITFANMAAGTYEFKFTKNGSWDNCLGGAFMGSGVESSLSSPGSNIVFTLDAANDVTIVMNPTTLKFTLTIGNQVDEAPEDMILHISVPESWGATYAYVWGPEHLGAWPGTKTETGDVSVTAAFEGMVINNGSGTQSKDIKDIDLTKSEVWITVHEDKTYTLSYEDPNQSVEPEPDPIANIKIHVIAPESWENVYAYSYTPEQCGTWPGTQVTDGVIEIPAEFEGFIVNNGAGIQTGDIKDIDLTKSEVWVVVAEDCSYALFYNEADVVLPTPAATIKINVVAEHWNAIYAYTYNPASCGNWPGMLVENGAFEVAATFEGLVLHNNEGVQTADIKDIDLTKEEVWIVVNEDNTVTISYEAPVVEEPVPPITGDNLLACVLVMAMAAAGIVMLTKKKEF